MDAWLFTPGPLTTSATVKAAMLHDVGSRDAAFIALVARVRRSLLAVAGLGPDDGYTCVPVQGSGTFGVEAAIGTLVPPGGRLLVLVNGAYGRRAVQIAQRLGIAVDALEDDERDRPDPERLDASLAADPSVTTVLAVHCETTTGILNPIAALGEVVQAHRRTFVVDAMSAFGALPTPLAAWGIDALIASSNKGLEGVPGLAFVLARHALLDAAAGWARSLSLDLTDQARVLDATGQFRFTPPTHVLLALDQALAELAAEGGPPGRLARYQANHRTLVAGMQTLGFVPFLLPDRQGPVITAFYEPAHPRFDFTAFYRGLAARGFVIYPGKLSQAACFRIGSIGRITPAEVEALLVAIAHVLADLGVPCPVPAPA